MDMQEKINLAKSNIRQAIKDYGAHSYQTAVLTNIDARFVEKLAEDNTYAKAELRTLFRKSPVWDETLDALVINGTRTHNPDYDIIAQLGDALLKPAYEKADFEVREKLGRVMQFFIGSQEDKASGIAAIQELAPHAYAPNKKPSRVFKALCQGLGIADESAGSTFQRLYAQFADELSAKKIGFKLYVSLNPAHFLTMSNPKEDSRGDTMTSCHSFNSTEYQYNCGCSGYARDSYTFIVFTAADPNVPETLNNRKTTRQIFAYKPYNGLLLQSRLYNTSGGTRGAQEESVLYRDLVQREISFLEDAPNLWKTFSYYNNGKFIIYAGTGFGGYCDWDYKEFDAKLSIREGCRESCRTFRIGTYGLCISCGREISHNLYCRDCCPDEDQECDDCDENCGELFRVYGEDDEERYVCSSCRNENYSRCAECGDYHYYGNVTETGNGRAVCHHCLEEHYALCSCCGKYFPKSEMREEWNADGSKSYMCITCQQAESSREAVA